MIVLICAHAQINDYSLSNLSTLTKVIRINQACELTDRNQLQTKSSNKNLRKFKGTLQLEGFQRAGSFSQAFIAD